MNTVDPNDSSFYQFASDLVSDQPAEALDAEIAGELAAIGIVKGKAFEPDARMREILTEAAAVGNAIARTLAFRPRTEDGVHYYGEASQWVNGLLAGGYDLMTPPAEVSDTGIGPYPSDGARKLHLRTQFFYLAWGISPAMCMRITNLGSQYLVTAADNEGRTLDGGRHYTVSLPPGIPAARFWFPDLVGQPDPVHARHTATILESRQPGLPSPGCDRRSRRVDDGALRARTPRRRTRWQLDPDDAGQGMVCVPASLQPAATVLRQVLAPRGARRSGDLKGSPPSMLGTSCCSPDDAPGGAGHLLRPRIGRRIV
ncbi:hypothetical protein Q3O43_07795 [Rhodococcus aetherivorans]|uniref:hypothetical protein n=1 Tax=Rhodococcus aetherivorans TaxID=191292 RepID=UPI002155BB16|nr:MULTISPECIES: hypothetical protein [Rhodococcus]WKX00189.1 hypothetical protein Q3O43_07795 [Rhodococcus aetherivorans]